MLEISYETSEQCVPCDSDCQECRETHVFAACAAGSKYTHRDVLRAEHYYFNKIIGGSYENHSKDVMFGHGFGS